MLGKLVVGVFCVGAALIVGISLKAQSDKAFDACESARRILAKPARSNGLLILDGADRLVISECVS